MNYKNYIFKETLISSVANGIFSFIFAFIVFHNMDLISSHDVLIDVFPQSLFVTFFAVFVPTLLTRNRLKKEVIESLPYHQNRWPGNAFIRAVLLGISVAIVATLSHFLLFQVITVDSLSFNNLVTYKVVYGMLLGVLITPWALQLALSEFSQTLK